MCTLACTVTLELNTPNGRQPVGAILILPGIPSCLGGPTQPRQWQRPPSPWKHPVSNIHISTRPRVRALSMILIILPISFVFIPTGKFQRSVPTSFAISIVSNVFTPIQPRVHALSMHLIILPISFVFIPTCEFHCSCATHFAIDEFANVHISICIPPFADALLFAIIIHFAIVISIGLCLVHHVGCCVFLRGAQKAA
jgi:hypothetical protein